MATVRRRAEAAAVVVLRMQQSRLLLQAGTGRCALFTRVCRNASAPMLLAAFYPRLAAYSDTNTVAHERLRLTRTAVATWCVVARRVLACCAAPPTVTHERVVVMCSADFILVAFDGRRIMVVYPASGDGAAQPSERSACCRAYCCVCVACVCVCVRVCVCVCVCVYTR